MRNQQGADLLRRLQRTQLQTGGLSYNFQRTCRVPEGRVNSLPAGLGAFPIYKVSDFRSGAPANWRPDGYFMPVYPQEAMWISFSGSSTPKATIVGAGNINAISGLAFQKNAQGVPEARLDESQNYMVVPPQPWLDGWKAEDGKIYQFVGAEMGSGQTVEGQITGEEKVGGIQMIVYDSKEPLQRHNRPQEYVIGGGNVKSPFFGGICTLGGPGVIVDDIEPEFSIDSLEAEVYCASVADMPTEGLKMNAMAMSADSSHIRRAASAIRSIRSMGLGRGGEISQKIYPDPYGLKIWKENPTAIDIVYMVSAEDFRQLTGHQAPPTPVTYEMYQSQGIPWFELCDKHLSDTPGSGVFGKLKPVTDGKIKT